MAARILQAFDLASAEIRETVIIGIAERLGEDDLRSFQNARRRLEHRFDILCGTSKVSGIQLPHEIQLQIVDLLEITDIYHCTNVCRQWRCLLLKCRQLTDDLLKKYFPAHFDNMCDESEWLYQALRKRHLRDSGRFRTRQVSPLFPPPPGRSLLTSFPDARFTCGFLRDADGTFAMDRVEGLQRGRTFKDLNCSGSPHPRPPNSTVAPMGLPGSASSSTFGAPPPPREILGHAVSRYLYSDGRLAWQLMLAPGEWAHSIIVHDFHAHRRWYLSLPAMRTKGIKLVLWALGSDLVVARAVGERVLYAWDLRSRAVDRVTLQNSPSKCFTRHYTVVIVSQSGELLLWSFGRGVANIDTAVPQDEDYRGLAQQKYLLKRPLPNFELHNLTVLFHPRDQDVFFLATFDDRHLHPGDLWVCEFRNRQCCQIFTYGVPPERRLSVVFNAIMVDAHGTYQLLEHEAPTENGVQLSGVTFNTISRSFRASSFQAPRNSESEKCLIWNDHLVLRYADPEASNIRRCPLLVVGPPPSHGSPKAVSDAVPGDKSLKRAMESMMTFGASLGIVKHNVVTSSQLRTMIPALEQGKPKHDIIRAPGISDSIPGLCSAVGLRYVLLFFGGQCNWEGDHIRDCPGASGLPNPFTRAEAILGDDEFLVIITDRNYYTVYAVDEDGQIGEAMRSSATVGAEEAPCESFPKRTRTAGGDS